MKAAVCTKNGPPEVLKLMDIEKPIPRNHEVLVKIHAATVTIGDVLIRKAKFPLSLLIRLAGFKKIVTGHELAGEIESVGKGVKSFKRGDQVFGTTTGLLYGANAQYVCLPEKWSKGVLTIKPGNMSYDEAAAVPIGGMTALQILRKGNVSSGQKVLIYGASGSVGTFAVQIARYFGAEVTGVCSTANIELVKLLGATRVIDYTKEDFTRTHETYDIVFDAVRKTSLSLSKCLLKKDGAFLSVRTPTKEKTEYLVFLKQLIENGELRSVVDRSYPLERIVEAHRYVEKGHKKGNVVITMN